MTTLDGTATTSAAQVPGSAAPVPGSAAPAAGDAEIPAGAATREEVLASARASQAAAAELALLPRSVKDLALQAMADALLDRRSEILAANELDVQAAIAGGTAESLVDRLRLTPSRVDAMAAGLRELAGLPDPVGTVVRGSVLPNGLHLTQVRVPLGVVAIIYEARPNVTVDAAGIAIKAGNAALLRGSASAHRSNRVLVDILARPPSAPVCRPTRCSWCRERTGSRCAI